MSESSKRDSLKKNFLESLRPGTAIHHMTDAVLLADADGVIVYVNPAYEELNEQNVESVVGLSISEALTACETSDMWRTLRAGRAWQAELHHAHPEGKHSESEIVITPLIDESGHIFEFVGVQRDITHFKAIQRLNLDFAGESLRDLYFPLTRMRVYQSLLRRGKPEKQSEYFTMIERQLSHMERMISNLTLLARLDQIRKGQIERHPADLNSLVSQIAARFTSVARKNELILEQKLDPDLPQIEINVELIIEAIRHLVENALVFTPSGGRIILETGVARRDDGDYVVVRVLDTGLGIPENERTSMFARRFRGTAAQEMNPDGTGLGLSIVSQIIELHNGHVEFASPAIDNKGSVFTLLFKL